jgi:hypothetical protein
VPLDVRFWSKVDQGGGPDACWPWTAKRRARGGYGQFRLDGKIEGAHRIAFSLKNGPLPAGAQVLHRCDNPPCCNPAHLFLGTNLDNVEDKVAKGRQAGGYKTAILGERHGMAKLTADDVREIRRMVAAGAMQKVVAEHFLIAGSAVSKIVARTSWRHVE